MRLRDLFAPRHIIFAVLIFVLLIPIAIRDSNNQVKVSFDGDNIYTTSNKYSLTIPYADIAQAELVDLAEAGEKVQDGYDDDILRAGIWKNDTWGEYHITADLDADNCILITLKDGRLFVLSRKDNATTEEIYHTLLGKLS